MQMQCLCFISMHGFKKVSVPVNIRLPENPITSSPTFNQLFPPTFSFIHSFQQSFHTLSFLFAVRFQPTQAEKAIARTEGLPATPSDLLGWNSSRSKALGISVIDGLPLSRLIPNKHLPHHKSSKSK